MPYEVEMALLGYYEEREELAGMIRIGSYRLHQSLVTKPLKIHEFWALPSDKISAKEQVKKFVDEEMLKIINKAHGTNFKIKNHGTA